MDAYIYLGIVLLGYLFLFLLAIHFLKRMNAEEKRIKNLGECPCEYPCCEYCHDKAQEENQINEHQIYK